MNNLCLIVKSAPIKDVYYCDGFYDYITGIIKYKRPTQIETPQPAQIETQQPAMETTVHSTTNGLKEYFICCDGLTSLQV